jgi:hypothetical protein
MDDDDKLTLRDKLAIAALPALMQRFTDKVESLWLTDGKPTEAFQEDIRVIALMAYKIADEMRKVRMIAFE